MHGRAPLLQAEQDARRRMLGRGLECCGETRRAAAGRDGMPAVIPCHGRVRTPRHP
jgi:hypothetical protein